jgi:hypothetical protein
MYYYASCLGWTEVNVQKQREPTLKVLVTNERRKEWDPGDTNLHVLFRTVIGATELECTDLSKFAMVHEFSMKLAQKIQWDPRVTVLLYASRAAYSMDIMPEETAVANPIRSMQIPFKLLICIERPVDLKHLRTQLSLQCHSWCTPPNAFLRVQYYFLPIVLDCLYPEPVQQLVCYSSLRHTSRNRGFSTGL